MPRKAIIWVNDNEIEFTVGKDGVTKVFQDKEVSTTLVICDETGIACYTGYPFVIYKDYKKEA